MFLIAILTDHSYGHCFQHLHIDNTKVIRYGHNDETWLEQKFDLLIVEYEGQTHLSESFLKYRANKNRKAIIPVWVDTINSLPASCFEGISTIRLSNEQEILKQRIQSHLFIQIKCSELSIHERSIFVSYRHKQDEEKAESIVKAIQQFDYSVTWDKHWPQLTLNDFSEEKIDKIIKKQIDEQLSKAIFTILVYTEATKSSKKFIRYEISTSKDTGKPVQKLSFDNHECIEYEELSQRCSPLIESHLDKQSAIAINAIEDFLSSQYERHPQTLKSKQTQASIT